MASLGSPPEKNGFRVEYRHGVIVLTPAGLLDSVATGRFEQLTAELVNGNWNLFLVDMGWVSLIDSVMAQLLTATARKARESGGSLVLLKPRHAVVLFLRNNGYASDLPIYEDRMVALRNLCKRSVTSTSEERRDEHKLSSSTEGALRKLLEINGFVLATIAETLHSQGILNDEDLSSLFGHSND